MGGISANTASNLLYGTNGYVSVNSTDIGATIGDFKFEFTQETFYPDIAQAPMAVAGTGKVISAGAKLTVSLTEWQYTVLSTLFASYGTNSTTSYTIGSGSIGAVTELDNVILTGIEKNSGKDVRVTLVKARITSALGATLSKKENASIEVTFEALSVVNSPATFPAFIEMEK